MHDFFNNTDAVASGVPKYGGYQWVRDGMKRNVGQVISFYRRNPMAVPGNHFLVRLLQNITVPLTQNLERYFDNVDSMALNLSMALKMTSSIFAGHVFNGVFYGPGTHEILLAHTASFNLQEAARDWQNLEPIKVLRCARSDLGLNLPDGRVTGTETGFAVLAINIPMLAVQYRGFWLEQQESKDSPKSVMQFLHMYVLPNMLWSQTDQVLFNRLDRLSRGQLFGESLRRHSFALPVQINDRITDLLRSVLLQLSRHSYTFTGMLQAIPALSQETMEPVMRVPAMAQTRQVAWALTIARLHALGFLFHASAEHPDFRNRTDINAIERAFISYRRNHVFEQYLPAELQPMVWQEIDEIVQLREQLPH